MAEDIHNPLSNPGSEPVGSEPAPHSEEPEIDTELSDFLDDILETSEPGEPEAGAATDEAEPVPPETTTPVVAGEPSGALSPAPDDDTAEGSTPPPEPPDPSPPSTIEPLQREVLEGINSYLAKMTQPEAAPPEGTTPITPQALLDYYQPQIQQAIRDGWVDEERAALYPMDVAMQIHMWNNLQQGGQQLQETRAFTEQEQKRQEQEFALNHLNAGMDEVAARGNEYAPLSDKEVRQGFLDFLIKDLRLDLPLSEITPDLLARQYYAYNHQLILDTVAQHRLASDTSEPSTTPSAAQLAQQEGGASRTAVPASPVRPEFVDMLQGNPAERWWE